MLIISSRISFWNINYLKHFYQEIILHDHTTLYLDIPQTVQLWLFMNFGFAFHGFLFLLLFFPYLKSNLNLFCSNLVNMLFDLGDFLILMILAIFSSLFVVFLLIFRFSVPIEELMFEFRISVRIC